jgi:RimJ/RimL family protein N-acetyltransferase
MPWERHTDRLVLRRWRDEDRAPFAALNADPEVRRHFVSTLTREESDASIDRFERTFEERGFGLWAVERRDTAEFIGFTGLNPMPEGIPGEGGVEIGWRLAQAHWGYGFATEAALESLRFAFDELGLAQVHSITALGNTRSRSVMERIGMVEAGHFEHPGVPEGHPLREHVRYVVGSLPAP